MRWMPDGKRVIFINGSSVRPEEVYTSSSAPRRVTRFRKKPLARSLQIKPRVVRFATLDRLKDAIYESVRKLAGIKEAILAA